VELHNFHVKLQVKQCDIDILETRMSSNTFARTTRQAFRRSLLGLAMGLSLGAGTLGLSTAAHADGPIIIKFSHVVAVDTPKGKAAEFFAKRAAELTKGKVKVEVYPNSQLYKDKEEMEALQLGSVQMRAPSLSKFAPLGVKEFEVFDLPFIFDDYNDLHKVTQGPVGAGLLKKLESRGITGLSYWDNGFKVMSANKPLKTVEDYKGLKMRIQSSKVLDAEMRALGALFTGSIATMGASFVWENGAHYAFFHAMGMNMTDLIEGPTTPDLEWPTWVIYLAIPLGSSLMCFRFLQVAVNFARTGELPHHDHGHVDGLEEETAKA